MTRIKDYNSNLLEEKFYWILIVDLKYIDMNWNKIPKFFKNFLYKAML